MPTSFAVIVGVEKFVDPNIGAVGHAESDAKAVAAALEGIGWAKENQTVLLSADASQANVRYSLKQQLATATKDDTLFFFFSGHGAALGTESHLIVRDSRLGDLKDTSLSLRDIFRWIDASSCQRVALFLDCCHAGLKFPKGEKSLLAKMDANEIEEFFRDSEYRVAFGSCKDSEKSYWNDVAGHGVWTHHLVEALTGKVPDILEKGRYLRASGLQDYLASEVPKTLRKIFTERRTQTPVLFGTLNRNFLIGDLDPVLPKLSGDEAVVVNRLKSASFIDKTIGRISSLSGFSRKAKHFVPERHSGQAEAFVQSAGSEEVNDLANELYARVKSSFGYGLHDLKLISDGGSATIRAKDFDLIIGLSQHSSDPGQYELRLEVDGFESPETVLSDAFNDAFDGYFSVLRLELTAEQNIEKLIERIEKAKIKGVEIDYPRQEPTYFSLTFAGKKGTFVFGKTWLKVKLTHAAPHDFIAALREVQMVLVDGSTPVGALLAPDGPNKKV